MPALFGPSATLEKDFRLHTAQLVVHAPLGVYRSEGSTVKQEPQHNVVAVLAEKPEDLCPRGFFQGPDIAVGASHHYTRNTALWSVGPYRCTPEAMREQVLVFLKGAIVLEELVDHEIHHLGR